MYLEQGIQTYRIDKDNPEIQSTSGSRSMLIRRDTKSGLAKILVSGRKGKKDDQNQGPRSGRR
jgi:hypothetical protein